MKEYTLGIFKYCVISNIIRPRVDEEEITRNRVVFFLGERKVYISRLLWDRGVVVLGLNRWHSRYILETLPLEYIEKKRPSRTFSKRVMVLMDDPEMPDVWWLYNDEDNKGTEEYADMLNKIKAGDQDLCEKYKREVRDQYC